MKTNFEDDLIALQVRLVNKLVTSTELALIIGQMGFTAEQNILDSNNKIENDVKILKEEHILRIDYEIVSDQDELQILRIVDIKEISDNSYYIIIEESYEDLELIDQSISLISSNFGEIKEYLYDKTNDLVEEPSYDEFIVLRGLSKNPEYNRFIIHTYDKEII